MVEHPDGHGLRRSANLLGMINIVTLHTRIDRVMDNLPCALLPLALWYRCLRWACQFVDDPGWSEPLQRGNWWILTVRVAWIL